MPSRALVVFSHITLTVAAVTCDIPGAGGAQSCDCTTALLELQAQLRGITGSAGERGLVYARGASDRGRPMAAYGGIVVARSEASTFMDRQTRKLAAMAWAGGEVAGNTHLAASTLHRWLDRARRNENFDRLLFPLLATHRGLVRVSPERLWRDFRLRPVTDASMAPIAPRAGRAVVGYLPQLHVCSGEERRQTSLQTSRPKPPRDGDRRTDHDQLSGCTRSVRCALLECQPKGLKGLRALPAFINIPLHPTNKLGNRVLRFEEFPRCVL